MSDKVESGGGPVNCSDSELCIFLAALGEGYCPTYYSDTSQSVQSKSMSIASRSCQHGKKTVAFHGFPSLRMSRNLTGDRGADLSMSSREDSPVKIFPSPGKERESTECAADCGESLPGSLARFDPASHSWRTAQPSLLGDSEECSVIWPRSGMTAAGQCWELDISGMITCEKESGLLPTPSGTSNHGKNHVSGRLDEWGGSSNPFRKTEIGKVHCASFEEWMMGWPAQWTVLTPLETDKYRMWLRQHGGF